METQAPRASTAFEELLRPVVGVAYRLALRLTQHPQNAEDLVQDAALRAFTAFAGFTPGTNFKAWFLRILVNGHLNEVRRRSRAPEELPLEDDDGLLLYHRALRQGRTRGGPDPAVVLLEKLDAGLIAAALAGLPEEYRVVCTLFFHDELTYEEIAAIVSCPIGTVRSRLHRGRRRLQRELWDLARERGLVRPAG